MSIRFNTYENVESELMELDSSAVDNFVDFEDTISVPANASYIKWIKIEFWQYGSNMPSQTGYIDSISIDK